MFASGGAWKYIDAAIAAAMITAVTQITCYIIIIQGTKQQPEI
jgi:hypothetical protein